MLMATTTWIQGLRGFKGLLLLGGLRLMGYNSCLQGHARLQAFVEIECDYHKSQPKEGRLGF